MSLLKNILGVTCLTLFIFSCKNEAQPEIKTVETEVSEVFNQADTNVTYATAEFGIEGMTCEIGCAKTIEKKLAKLNGVKSVEVDFKNEMAMVEFNEANVNLTKLEETVTNIGDGKTYKVTDMKTIESFAAKKGHPEDCDMSCCAGKSEVEKKACSADCKMACCADKKDKS